MSEPDLVLEPPPPADEETPASPHSGPLEEPEALATPDEPEAPPVEKPKRSIVSDLQAERTARRQAEETAQRAQQEAAQMRPIMQALAKHPNGVAILQSLVQGAPLPSQGPPQADPELQAIAEDLGLYNVDGTPDLVKAGRVAQRQAAVAQRAVQAAVQPMQQQTVQQQAAGARQHLWQQAHQPDNAHVDPGALRELLQALPDDIVAHQEVQSLVWVLAAGATALQGGRHGVQPKPDVPFTQPSAAPPVFTEQAGGRARAPAPLAAPFQAILKRAGISDKDLQSTLGKFTPGMPNLLE